jgi:hypothetical protein
MIELFVLETERERIEFLSLELAEKYAIENEMKVKPYPFKKELPKEEINPLY